MTPGLRRHVVAEGRMHMRIEADLAGLQAGRLALTAFLAGAGAGDRGLHHAELAYEELVTNVIKYAFAEGDCRGIDVAAGLEGDEITLVIEDDGVAFDPVSAPEAVPDARGGPVGGRGLRLVKKAASRLRYERHDGRNRVTVAVRRG